MTALATDLIIRRLATTDYQTTWHAMQAFTDARTSATCDEFWLLEHTPIFTLGQNGKPEHILDAADIPVIQVDRGGQVTYHGPGQVIVYVLIDIKRRHLGIRQLVSLLEKSIIALLADYALTAYAKPTAPGVYIAQAKIGSVGLRVRRGCCFHGLSFNVDMDLSPFARINPCGYKNLAVTQLCDLINGNDLDKELVCAQLVQHLINHLQYQQPLMLA